VTHRTRIIFTAGAGLRTFVANPFNTCIALSKAKMLISLHAGYINYILFKAVVVNKPKHGETRSSVCNTCSQY